MKRLFTLLSFTLLTGAAFAQIPNAGFDTWTSVTSGAGSYRVATGWDSPNPTTAAVGVYTCDSGTTTATPLNAYAKLTTKLCGPLAVPGVAVTGHLNINAATATYTVTGGFVNTTRPASLTGSFQHMPTGADHGRMGVFLWKWNTATSTRDTIAFADTTLTGMAMSWTTFTIPLTYHHGANPDSGSIVLSSSAVTPVAGSYLYVDGLSFTGTVPNGVVNVNNTSTATMVYPNPATGITSVFYNSTAGTDVAVSLTDMSGRTVKSFKTKTVHGENDIPVDLHGVAQGIYIIKLVDETGTVEKKLMVQ